MPPLRSTKFKSTILRTVTFHNTNDKMRRKSYIIVLIVLVGFLSNVSSLNELSKDEVSTIRSVSLLSLFVMQQESPFIQIIPYPLSSHLFLLNIGTNQITVE